MALVVRELLTRLGFSVNDANLRKYERGVDNIKESAQQAADAFTGMLAAFAGLAALQGLARVADQMQSLEARVGMLPQTITDSAAAFDEVANRATAARTSIDAYATLYARIGNAAQDYVKTQDDLLAVTDTISKALVVGGATTMEANSAMLQFAQALGAGTLQGEEFRAMAEAAPQYLDQLAKSLGYPRGELKELASEGKLTSKEVIEATRDMAEYFDTKFHQMPITIGQATLIIGNRWGAFVNRLNRESGAVTTVANLFLDAFDKIESGLDSVVEFFGGATNTLKFFAIVITAAVLPALVRLGVGMVAFLVTPAGLLFAALIAVALALEDFYVWLNGGDSVLGDIFGSSEEFRTSLIGMWEWLKAVGKAFVEAFSWGWILDDVFRSLNGLWQMIKSIGSALMAVGRMAAAAFRFDWAGIKAGANDLMNSVKQFNVGAGNLLTGGVNAAVGVGVGAANLASRAFAPVQNNNYNVTLPAGTPQQHVQQFQQAISAANISYTPVQALRVQGQ